MLGKDPIKRGLNPYPYCDNDPVDYTDPTGEIPSIVVSALIGGAIGAVSGFVDSAISQVTGGQKFNLNGALGAAANGAVVGAARGALAGTGVGIPLAFATDFAAGTLGSALEQYISEGKVSARKSVTRGLTNAASNMFYGTGKMGSIREAFGRGFGAGAATSGINYISDAIGSRQGQPSRSKAGMAGALAGLDAPVYGMFRNPRNNCGSGSAFDTGLGYSSAKGYRYKTPQTRNGNGAGKGFSLAGFVRETLIGGVTGGLGSAAFYGAGKAVEKLRNSLHNINRTRREKGITISASGKPEDIYYNNTELNKRQQKLLSQLQAYGDSVVVKKKEVNLKDISALTAYTNKEFALFTNSGRRMIIRGDLMSVPVNAAMAKELASQGWRWSGHSHPGNSRTVLIASDPDRYILKQFVNQVKSVTVNSVGQYRDFGKDWSTWLPGD